jgi:hypothetical protein
VESERELTCAKKFQYWIPFRPNDELSREDVMMTYRSKLSTRYTKRQG